MRSPVARMITPAGAYAVPADATALGLAFQAGGIMLHFCGPDGAHVMVQLLLDAVTVEAVSGLLHWYDHNPDFDLDVMRFHDLKHYCVTEPETVFGSGEQVRSHRDLFALLEGKLVYGLA